MISNIFGRILTDMCTNSIVSAYCVWGGKVKLFVVKLLASKLLLSEAETCWNDLLSVCEFVKLKTTTKDDVHDKSRFKFFILKKVR